MKGIHIIKISLILLLSFFILLPRAYADTKISYRGIHSGKAWISINGRLAKLRAGQKSKEGVKLLTVSKNSITLIVDGKSYQYDKGAKKGILLDNEVELTRNPANGNFFSKGAVNGKPAIFLVDTGASFVVLNKNHAKMLNIRLGKKKIKVSTASKDEDAYLVTLKSVRIGDIELKNIEAIISIHNEHPRIPLLGMSFLKKVDVSQSAEKMIITYGGNNL